MNAGAGQTTRIAERARAKLNLPPGAATTARTFLSRTVAAVKRDHISVYAGNLAYRVLFAMFPALVSLFWLLKVFGATRLLNNVIDITTTALPHTANGSLKEQLTNISGAQSGGTLTLGAVISLVVAIVAIFAVFRAAMNAMNSVYEVEESRSWLRRQATLLLLSIAVTVLLAGSLGVLLLKDGIAQRLGTLAGGGLLRWVWLAGTWPVLLIGVLAAFALVYYFGPDVKQEFRWINRGSIIAAVLWLLFAIGFSFYINEFVSPGQTYGALAGIAVLMVYLYCSSFILLLGAEMNQVLEAKDPEGKNSGERQPRT